MESEYIELWNTLLSQQTARLPIALELGLSNTKYKVSSDTLDTIRNKQNEIVAKISELGLLDIQYKHALLEVKNKPTDTPRNENITRVTDFLISLIVSFNVDFNKQADLLHAMQQLYLMNKNALK